MKVRLTILSTLLWSPTVWMAVWAFRDYHLRGSLAILIAASLTALLMAAGTRKWRTYFLCFFPLFLLSIAFLIYTLSFHMPPGHTLSMIIEGATWEELRGLLQFPPGRQWLIVIVIAAGSYLTLTVTLGYVPIFNASMTLASRAVVTLLLPITAYCAVNPSQLIDGLSLNPMLGSVMFFVLTVPRAADEVHGARVHKVPFGATRSGGEEVHVLVVGESARRGSWSAYGYQRQTTPFLNGLGREAVFFRNAIADANLTEAAVPILLTGMTPDNFVLANIRGNIVDLAKEAGYSTAWLVNQDIGISTSIGITPDRLINPPDVNATINGRHSYDEVLLPGFNREVARSGSRFIGLHTMGSHWEYYLRYPEKYRRFGDGEKLGMLAMMLESQKTESAVVDAYDNSVVYTDWFLQQIIEAGRRLSVPATVTFFPDHGEDLEGLDGQAGHGQPRYTQHAFEIPAFIWMNGAYRQAHPAVVQALEANAGKEMRTHNVFYTVADLLGIRWPGASESSSAASDTFDPDLSMLHIAGGVLVQRQ